MPGDTDIGIDVLGETPALFKLYTQISSIYYLPDDVPHSSIIDTLTSGLERLSSSFPWIAGQVVKQNSSDEGTEEYKIAPLDKTIRLTVNNDGSLPKMTDLRAEKFPFSMLDEKAIAPCNTLQFLTFNPNQASGTGEAPVFLVQANFLPEGGLIITFNAQHNVMDMTGQAQMIELLSKACKGIPFTSEELEIGNMARRNLIPLLENYTPGPELSQQLIRPSKEHPPEGATNSDQAPPPPPPPPSCSWVYLSFSASSLTALKAQATSTLPSSTGFISTDDALSAFLWQSVLRARSSRLDPNKNVTFARAVDARRYLSIPSTYPGVVQNMTYHTYPLHQLLNLPLGPIASNLRAAVDPKTSDIAYRTRALATFLRSSPENKSRANFTANLDVSADIMLSSWSKISLYDLDFGLGLGKPEAVRRPAFVPVESLFYLMPKGGEGDVAVAMCLREGDLETLRGDAEFGKYAIFVG